MSSYMHVYAGPMVRIPRDSDFNIDDLKVDVFFEPEMPESKSEYWLLIPNSIDLRGVNKFWVSEMDNIKSPAFITSSSIVEDCRLFTERSEEHLKMINAPYEIVWGICNYFL